MFSIGQRRATLLLAVSGLAHLGVFLLLALKTPRLQSAAPPPTLEVTIVPRFAAAPRRQADSQPLRPRRTLRPSARPGVASPVADTAAGKPEPSLPVAPSAAAAGLRQALRRGPAGCANPDLLDKAEREACLETFGKAAASAPFIAPPMARDKRAGFDEKVAAQEQMRIYRETGIYSGMRDAYKAAR